MGERYSAVQAARQIVIEREKKPLFGPRAPDRAAQLEAALVALIDAIDAKDNKAIETAMFVGRGLTF